MTTRVVPRVKAFEGTLAKADEVNFSSSESPKVVGVCKGLFSLACLQKPSPVIPKASFIRPLKLIPKKQKEMTVDELVTKVIQENKDELKNLVIVSAIKGFHPLDKALVIIKTGLYKEIGTGKIKIKPTYVDPEDGGVKQSPEEIIKEEFAGFASSLFDWTSEDILAFQQNTVEPDQNTVEPDDSSDDEIEELTTPS